MDVHSKLRELLVCEYLRPERESSKFRMLCKSDIPPAERSNVEDILNHLERTGKFNEGNYDYVKGKVEGIDVAITYLIYEAERKIEEIKGNSLLVIAEVSEVDPIHLEKKTREEVDLILLAVSEKLLCRSDEDAEIVCGLWERYQDLNTLSEDFLNIWHTKFCKCRKQHGRLLLLKFIKKGAYSLEQGETEFDRFKWRIAPTLLATLQQSAIITLHVFENCGASIVSVVRSSVSFYWVFDSVLNLDKLWRTYEEGGLHVELQDCFNAEEALHLLKVDRIKLKMTIQKSDYLKYRSILEKTVPKDHSPASRLQTLDFNPVKSPVETIITTEGDPLVDSEEALKLHYTKRMETATETEYSKHFEIIEASLRDPLSDPDIVKVKREKKAPTYLASPLQTSDLDPVKYPVETTKTTEGDPLKDGIEPLKLDHAKRIEKTTETEYSKHLKKIEASLKDPFSNPYIAQVKRGEIPIYSDLMKKRLYEINKRLSETPTVLSYLLQSGDKMTRESLYASVSLLEYDDQWHLLHSRHSTKIENIPDHIFCTSDEYLWKGRRSISKRMFRIRDEDFENTNSALLFIIGEAGCGKTSYCKHLLRQWCRGKELQKFDHVFYIDTSVLQTSKTSMSDLISFAVFGNVIFSENEVDCVLRNEKCLILIDGDEYFRGSLLREYEIEKSTTEYCNCVFVFLMRPLHFLRANLFYPFEMLKVEVSYIQLLGLDEKGMASLYSDVMIESNKRKQSERGHEIKKAGDSQQIMNKPTLHEEKGEPDTAFTVTEFYLKFQNEGESDTQAYIAQNPTDLEQLVKNPGSGDFAKEAETKPKTEKDVSKHDRKELEFYLIKGILERGLRENYDLIMKIPMLGSVCVGLLAEGKDLPRNFLNLYLCLIDKLVGGHESLSGGKGEKSIKQFNLFLPYENVHRHVETLRKLGKIAYNSIFSPVFKSLNYRTLDGYLEETEIDFAIRTGLLVPVQTFKDEIADEQNVRFLNKNIRDSLVSIYIVIRKEEAFDSFCQQLTSLDVIIDVSHVIMMVCGLNPNLGCRITRSIKDVLDKDEHVIRHRQNLWMDSFVRELYYLQLSWYSEYNDKVTNIGSDTKDSFYVSDIYVDDKTDKETITKTIVLLSDKNVIVTSLYIRDVPAESGLSDKKLNDFLALNASALKSLYVRGLGTYRSIEPLSFPVLTVLMLRDVHIWPASSDNEATQPLLYHLPMLQRLDLINIKLNNRLLGFTSIEGRMPILKKVYIIEVDMNDQSMELAPDMREIEDIDLVDVQMSPPANSLLVKAFVTEADPSRLEKETREEVDLILLAVSEKLLCRSDEDAEIVCGLWERYQDLNTLSEDFLNIWHTKFCKCRKQHGRLLLLKFIKKGAHSLEQGETEFDRFKRTIAPTLLTTLQKSAIITLHVFGNCGASIVSVVRSSVSTYWVFDSVLNLDKLWKTYEEGGLHVELQDCFNAEEALHLLKVDRITLKMTIQKSDYLKYRSIFEKKAPKYLASRFQIRDLDLEEIPVLSFGTTEWDPLVESIQALKLDHAKRTDKTTKTEYSKYFEKIEASMRDPLSDPDIVKVKREKKAPKYLSSRLQIRDLDPVEYPVETTKTTEGDPLVDSKEALKLDHAKRTDKTTETEYLEYFEDIAPPSLIDLFSDPDIVKVKREKKAPKYLSSRLQIRDLDPVEYPVETTKTTEGDPLVDSKEALKLDHAKRTDKTTETEYLEYFEDIAPPSLIDLFSDPDIVKVKREKKAPKYLSSRLQIRDLDPVEYPVETTKTTEGDPLVDSKEALKLDHAKRTDKTTETEYLEYFEDIAPPSLIDLFSDPDIVKVKREKKAPKYLSSRLQIRDLDPVEYPVETTKTTEGDPLVDSKEALKLDHAKRTDKTTETEYLEYFEDIAPPSLIDLFSDPDIVKVKREKKAPKYLSSRLQICDVDPVESTKTTEGDPLVNRKEALKLDHAKRTVKPSKTEYSKHLEKIETSLKEPFSNPDIAQVKRGEIPIYSDLMKKRLYEINKRLSETPTVLSYLLQSGDKMTREPLYASVSLLEYDNEWHLLHSRHSTKIENIPDHIFCTSDEYLWKGRRSSISESMYRKRDEYFKNTNSISVFILGEAGCGKTSYCKHLLRQWCRGEELQKFDHVFYIDTSVLQTSKTPISNLISSAVFGNVIFSENEVDSVLRNEKCLILIDGDEYFKGSLLREYEIEKSTMEYCNCVFVFLMRPLHLMRAKSFYSFEMLEVNVSFIQLLGLDEKGMASLYNDVMIESNVMKQSERGHEIKKGGDSQQIINKPTLQEEKAEPDTALSVTESYLFQSKGKPDTQAYTAQNPTDLKQLAKNPDSGDFAKGAQTKPKIEKDVSKHDRKELEFYKIKGMLERGLRDNYDFIMKIPMLGSVCVGLLAEGKDLPRNFTNLYLCLINKLLGGHGSLSGGKGEKGIEHFDLFLPYENVLRHVETLRKLGKIAYNSTFSAASQLVNYKTLDRYYEETEIDFAIRTGLLVSVQTLTGKTSDEQNVRFLHKTIQDSLVSIYIVMEKEEAIYFFCQQLTSVDVIIDVSHVIMMVCGLNPNLGCRITRSIKDVLDKDKTIIRHRQNLWIDSFVREFYRLQLSWYLEYKNKVTNIGSDTKDSFYVSNIYLDDETDKDTVTKTIVLLSDKNVIVTSLYINNVPAESGLSNKVLNDFLALNASALESLYVRGRQTYRSIEPLSFPVLTMLKLRYVHIRPASSDDEATKPLLYHLPMLQHLSLCNIELNNTRLGFTSNKGKMRKLKTFYIDEVDMGDQSIELASDMTDIKDIDFVDVKMSPEGWMKFIRSLLNIHHSYRVTLNNSDIDVKSLDMVRTDKKFEVKGESQTYVTSFVRV